MCNLVYLSIIMFTLYFSIDTMGNIYHRKRGLVYAKSAESDKDAAPKYNYELQLTLIREYIKREDYHAAIELCNRLISTFSDNSQIRYLRGILNQKAGNLENAIADYNFLIDSRIADAKIFNNLGIIYTGRKEYEKAAQLFVKAITANSQLTEAHENLAELSAETKDYSRAIDEYERVVELEPYNTRALYNLGIVYGYIGDYTKAKARWMKALAISSEDKDVKNALEKLEGKR